MTVGIFVFGSNLAGRHGAGAALDAWKHHRAQRGVGKGPTGRAYAIPTKDRDLKPLPLSEIALHVYEFIAYAAAHPELEFHLTRVGCGLAGYTDTDIAPLFAMAPPNVIRPKGW